MHAFKIKTYHFWRDYGAINIHVCEDAIILKIN